MKWFKVETTHLQLVMGQKYCFKNRFEKFQNSFSNFDWQWDEREIDDDIMCSSRSLFDIYMSSSNILQTK